MIKAMCRSLCTWQICGSMKVLTKRNKKRCAAARRIGHGDRSVMSGYDIVGNRQSQPEVIFIASGFFTAVKAVKYPGFFLVADSNTRVGYPDFKMSV